MEDKLRIGVITSPHGVHGEVRVYPTTDDVKRFKGMKSAILVTKKGESEVHIRSVKFQKNMVILGFEEYDTMNEAETLRDADICVTRDNAIKLGPDEYFISDLIGLKVITDIESDGVLKDVMTTGANDVYVIDLDDGREMLLPAIADCVKEVDIAGGTMHVHVLPGLMDEPVRA